MFEDINIPNLIIQRATSTEYFLYRDRLECVKFSVKKENEKLVDKVLTQMYPDYKFIFECTEYREVDFEGQDTRYEPRVYFMVHVSDKEGQSLTRKIRDEIYREIQRTICKIKNGEKDIVFDIENFRKISFHETNQEFQNIITCKALGLQEYENRTGMRVPLRLRRNVDKLSDLMKENFNYLFHTIDLRKMIIDHVATTRYMIYENGDASITMPFDFSEELQDEKVSETELCESLKHYLTKNYLGHTFNVRCRLDRELGYVGYFYIGIKDRNKNWFLPWLRKEMLESLKYINSYNIDGFSFQIDDLIVKRIRLEEFSKHFQNILSCMVVSEENCSEYNKKHVEDLKRVMNNSDFEYIPY